ncbi:low temperature requirement protein A [Streptomyces parvulus]|uniref:low temperature requirement protein A n=1 Tax=Streptomyces parvulus TaxID=146923 RepID=UPI0036F9F2C8
MACGGALASFAMWWLYFAASARTALSTTWRTGRRRFVWAYGHYLILTSTAAEGAGLAAYADHVAERAQLSGLAAGPPRTGRDAGAPPRRC